MLPVLALRSGGLCQMGAVRQAPLLRMQRRWIHIMSVMCT